MAEITLSLTLQLAGGNGSHVIDTRKALIDWINEERVYWKFTGSAEGKVSVMYGEYLNEVLALIPLDETQLIGALPRIEARLREFYKEHIHRNSVKGRFIESLRSKDDPATEMVAAAAAAFLMGVPLSQPERPLSIRGVYRAIRYEEGDAYSVGSSTATFEALHGEILGWLHGAKQELSRLQADVVRVTADVMGFRASHEHALAADRKQTNTELRTVQKKLEEGNQQILSGAKSQLDGLVNGTTATVQELERTIQENLKRHEADLKAITETYDTKLSLAAPVEYWKEKEKLHRERVRLFGFGFFGSVVLGGVFLYLTIGTILPEAYSSSTLPIGKIAESAVVVTFTVWLMRTLARLFLSNLHLATDAQERVVMVTTYLALLRVQAGLADDDRKHVIEALFRRASTGIVKDDANPPWMMGLFNRPDKD